METRQVVLKRPLRHELSAGQEVETCRVDGQGTQHDGLLRLKYSNVVLALCRILKYSKAPAGKIPRLEYSRRDTVRG